MLVGRSLNKSCEFVTLLTFKDTDLTSVIVGSSAAKTNVNRPADKKSSKLGNWSNTPALVRTNADWPKITLIIAVNHAMQSRNNRILSMRIWNEDVLKGAVCVFKTGFNPFSQMLFKINVVCLSAAIMKWRHFLFKERKLVEIV